MGITFTPFQLILIIIELLAVAALFVCISKRKYKIATGLAAIMAIIPLTQPIRLTTNTGEYNAKMNQSIQQKHRQQLEELPPRVTVEREDYDSYLERQKKQLDN